MDQHPQPVLPVGPTIDQVVGEIEREQAVADYVEAQRQRMRAAMGMASAVALQETIAALAREQAELVLHRGVPAEPLIAALDAATAEGRRLLGLLGIDLTTGTDPAEGGA